MLQEAVTNLNRRSGLNPTWGIMGRFRRRPGSMLATRFTCSQVVQIVNNQFAPSTHTAKPIAQLMASLCTQLHASKTGGS